MKKMFLLAMIAVSVNLYSETFEYQVRDWFGSGYRSFVLVGKGLVVDYESMYVFKEIAYNNNDPYIVLYNNKTRTEWKIYIDCKRTKFYCEEWSSSVYALRTTPEKYNWELVADSIANNYIRFVKKEKEQ